MDDLKQINLDDSSKQESDINENPILENKVMDLNKKTKVIPILIIVGILLGLGTGFFVAQKKILVAGGGASLLDSKTQELTSSTTVKVGDTFGSADEKTFRDQAEGILITGGIDGEGSHHIERGANKTQWVFITSSVVDLDLLVGDRVIVWGETNQGKKAGWLMDVGRLKIIELNAAPSADPTGNQD